MESVRYGVGAEGLIDGARRMILLFTEYYGRVSIWKATMVEAANEPQPLSPVVFHVLLALSSGPMHGYAVMKRVEEDSGLRMGPGTVYGSIQRLTDAGWLRDAGADLEDARRGRRFALTPAGRRALQAEAARITRLARLPEVRELAPERGGHS
jgi:DNA-binding PadR family transcriptional regulator